MTPNFGDGTGFDIGNIGGKLLLGARRTLKIQHGVGHSKRLHNSAKALKRPNVFLFS